MKELDASHHLMKGDAHDATANDEGDGADIVPGIGNGEPSRAEGGKEKCLDEEYLQAGFADSAYHGIETPQ